METFENLLREYKNPPMILTTFSGHPKDILPDTSGRIQTTQASGPTGLAVVLSLLHA